MEYLRCASSIVSLDKIKMESSEKGDVIFVLGDVSYNFSFDGSTLVADQNFSSEHLERILRIYKYNVVFEHNAYDLMMFLNANLSTIRGYCTICGTLIKSTKIAACTNCSTDDIVIDNTITDAIRHDYSAFNFLLATAYACLSHIQARNVFDPYPKFIKSEKDLRYTFATLSLLVAEIQKAGDDYVLYNTIGKLDYAFIKFVLGTNNTILRSDTLFDNKNDNVFVEAMGDIFLSNDKNVTVLQISYDPLTEVRFRGAQTTYLFHGSSLSNWYSILRNGLKVYSKTKLMSAGAAYGEGIYLSDSAAFSHGYGVDKYCTSKCVAIGVVQTLQGKEAYHKAPSIYVVGNDAEIILRYVIVMKGSDQNVLSRITDYFTVMKAREVTGSSIDVLRIRTKRMGKEYEKLESIGRKRGIEVKEDGDSIVVVVKETTLRIYFPENYPSVPPFVWINTLGNQMSADCVILQLGGVLINELNPVGWKSSTKVSSLIKRLIDCVGDSVDDVRVFKFDEAYGEYTKKTFRM